MSSKIIRNFLIIVFLAVFVFTAVKFFDGVKYFSKKITPSQPIAQAAATAELSGWAWSNHIGWVSFNSKNCDANGDGLSDGGTPGCPAAGSPVAPYGVVVDSATGNFSGSAWSENIGWFSFNSADVAGCPSGTCQPHYDSITQKLSGWARILSEVAGNPNKSWLHLDGAGYEVVLNSATCKFDGWAWSDATVGWFSFNSANSYPGKTPGADYAVASQQLCSGLPSVESVSYPSQPVVQPDYCSSSAVVFNWVYQDVSGKEAAYFQLQVDDNVDFSSPIVDSGQQVPINKSSGSIQSYQLLVGSVLPWTGINPDYYWRVKVWNVNNIESDWYNGPDTFSNPKHPYPSVNFNYSPLSPGAGDPILFTDTSTYSFASGGSFISRLWTFEPSAPDLVDIAPYSPANPQSNKTSSNSPVEIKVYDVNSGGVILNFSLFAKNDNNDIKGFGYECARIIGTVGGVVGEGAGAGAGAGGEGGGGEGGGAGIGIKIKPPLPEYKEVKPR